MGHLPFGFVPFYINTSLFSTQYLVLPQHFVYRHCYAHRQIEGAHRPGHGYAQCWITFQHLGGQPPGLGAEEQKVLGAQPGLVQRPPGLRGKGPDARAFRKGLEESLPRVVQHHVHVRPVVQARALQARVAPTESKGTHQVQLAGGGGGRAGDVAGVLRYLGLVEDYSRHGLILPRGKLAVVNDLRALTDLLESLDGRSYGAYKQIKGTWMGPGFALIIDHVQPDPFATPSLVCLRVARETHGIPAELWSNRARKKGLLDYLLRVFAGAVEACPGVGSGRSCEIFVDAGGAEILERSAADIGENYLSLRFRVGLPARGRTVLGKAAARLMGEVLPQALNAVYWSNLPHSVAREWAYLSEDHAHLQDQLKESGLVAFVADGSILPRESGVSARPLANAVPFASPAGLRVTLETLHHGPVSGMGLPAGVTVISGGGFHGKTTLLEAIELGVYPHVPDDGREWVVTRSDAVKLRSEDGRAVTGVYLTPFIHDLPLGADTEFFTTADASGSTSLAAAIMEALEVGAGAILIDEDTAATNMLVRDARMQRLVERETIVPLIDHARELYERAGVSTILVTGGSGDYLDVADLVLLLEEYRVMDATERARAIVAELPLSRTGEPAAPARPRDRYPLAASFDARRRGREKVSVRGLRELVFGGQAVNTDGLEQLVSPSQLRAVGALLKRARRYADGRTSLCRLVDKLEEDVDTNGLYALEASPELARPRRFELAAVINRLRKLRLRQPSAALKNDE